MKLNWRKFTAPAWLSEGLCLAVCLAAGGVVSLLAGRDLSAAPVETTLYPAHALLTGRMGTDIFAAGAGPALNPLLHIPYYLTFVKLNAWPHVSLFLSGISYGLFLFFVWKICSRAFEKLGGLLSAVLAVLGVTGAAALAGVGGVNGALWLAALSAWACWLLFYGKSPRAFKGAFFIAAFALGLSFSALPAWLGFLMAAAVLRAEKKSSWLVCAGWSAAGFLAALSVGVLYAWRTGALDTFWTFFYPQGWAFGAPDWAAKWEAPLGVWEWLLLPVWRMRYSLPGYMLDPRIACGLVAAFVLLGKRLFGPSSVRETAWSVFFLGAYAVWLVGFRDAASSIVLEFAGVLLLGRCLGWLIEARAGVLAAAVLLWVVFPPALPQGRLAVEDYNFAFFKNPVLSQKPLVLLSGHVSGWVAFLPQDARYAGGIWFDPQDYNSSKEFFLHRLNPLPAGYYSHRRDGAVREAVRTHEGDIYAIFPKESLADSSVVWRRYGVELAQPLSACQMLYPACLVEAKEFLLCRVRKLPDEK